MSVSERFTNNFDLIRFTGAVLIIFSHSFALTLGYSNVLPFDWHLLIGQAGLAALLVTSGFLIPNSWLRSPKIIPFFKKRILRIFPSLIASAAVILLIIGPIATSLSLPEYFSALINPESWSSVPFYKDGSALGLFMNNPVPYVDAPLWAIPFEFGLYVIAALIGILGLLSKRYSAIPFAVIGILLWVMWYDNAALAKIRFAVYFFIGAFLWMNRDKIKYRWYYALIMWACAFACFNTMFFFMFAFIALPYTVIWFAELPSHALNNFGKYGDFSLGLFLFSYPIQQVLVQFIPGISAWLLFIAAFIITMPVACLSWNLIEKHALKKKDELVCPK